MMGTKPKMKLGWKRLLKLADILDVADAAHRANKEPRYDQRKLQHSCGTPACAIGHYISAHSRRGWKVTDGLVYFKGKYAYFSDDSICREFEIAPGEGIELFDADGCGRAKTAKNAAKYIRWFVAQKLKSAV